MLAGAAVVAVAGALIGVAGLRSSSDPDRDLVPPPDAAVGDAVPLLGNDHIPVGSRVDYNSNPPTSGDHWPEPAAWGAYREPLPDELVVHNLEHGGTWLSYRDLDDRSVARLEAIAAEYPQAVIVTPRPANDSPVVAASWGRLLRLDTVDEEAIVRFVRANLNRSPEPFASLEGP